MKKLLTIALVLIIALGCLIGLTACDTADYTVGVCQLMQHPSLDQATQGFKDALEEELAKAGKTVKIDVQNASGETTNCTTIISSFVAGRYDLILANATPALQSAANATQTIPVLGTSVTDYNEALGATIPANVSGTSDLVSLEEHAKMIKDLFPSAQKVGILYCSNEPNSKYQADSLTAELTKLGISSSAYTFAESNDIQTVTTRACSADENCDLLYIPTDNMAATYASTIAAICGPANMPVVTADESTCKTCGVATLSISYYELGKITGRMAAEILLGTKSVDEIEIAFAEPTYKYNKTIAEQLQISIDTTKYIEIE